MSKKIERICRYCKLWDPEERVCSITVIMNGEDYELTTEAGDRCYWEEAGLLDEIRQTRVWSDGNNGFIEF